MSSRVRLTGMEVLADDWYVLRKATFEFRRSDGSWETQSREAYDRGNGATVLLYDAPRRTVLLTRQFRLPTWVNGNPDGMLIEAPAGLLDEDDPETAVRREAEEETGVTVGEVQRLFEVFMSPGSVTERVAFFAAPYDAAARDRTKGGGLASDGEDIEVLELDVDEALGMVDRGEIADAKTIMLLQWAVLSGPWSART